MHQPKNKDAALALYRWMECITKALITTKGTIRNKFFHEQMNAVERNWYEFQHALGQERKSPDEQTQARKVHRSKKAEG